MEKKPRCHAPQAACVRVCVYIYTCALCAHTNRAHLGLKWLSCRMLLLGDQSVSPLPPSNLNSERDVLSALGTARTNIEGYLHLFQESTFFFLF